MTGGAWATLYGTDDERVSRLLELVFTAMPEDQRPACKLLRVWIEELLPASPGKWAQALSTGQITIVPRALQLTDAAFAQLLAHEVAHVSISGEGGDIGDEGLASAKAQSWGFGNQLLKTECDALNVTP